MGRDGQGVGQPLLVQRKQHVDRGLVALLDRRRRIAAHHALLAEILEDQESLIQISVMDDRCGESVLPQAVRHRHERHDIVGKMRDRAVGLAARAPAGRRPGAAMFIRITCLSPSASRSYERVEASPCIRTRSASL